MRQILVNDKLLKMLLGVVGLDEWFLMEVVSERTQAPRRLLMRAFSLGFYASAPGICGRLASFSSKISSLMRFIIVMDGLDDSHSLSTFNLWHTLSNIQLFFLSNIYLLYAYSAIILVS